MRNLCLALLVSCLLAAIANSQQPSKTPGSAPPAGGPVAPAHSKQTDVAPSGTAADKAADALKPGANKYLEESFVIEQMHSHYRFEADGTGRKETKARIRVQIG